MSNRRSGLLRSGNPLHTPGWTVQCYLRQNRTLDLKQATEMDGWHQAKNFGYTIVTKDKEPAAVTTPALSSLGWDPAARRS